VTRTGWKDRIAELGKGAMNGQNGGGKASARLRSRKDFLRAAGAAGIGAAFVPIFATACVPPGGRLDQRALAKVGRKGQQD
jgi:hypothetical protein